MKWLLALALTAGLSGIAAANPPACTTQARSCGSWSDWYEIATSCHLTKYCDGQWSPIPVQATVEEQQQFRSCVPRRQPVRRDQGPVRQLLRLLTSERPDLEAR